MPPSLIPLTVAWLAGVAGLQARAGLPAPACLAALAALGVLAAAGAMVASGCCAPRLAAGAGAARGRAVAAALSVLAALAAGFAWSAWRAVDRLADEMPAAWERRDIELVGTIAELTTRTERGLRFVLDVEQVITAQAVVPRRVLLNWYGELPGRRAAADAANEPAADLQPAQAGERWRLVVRLRRAHGSVNPHGFDTEAWLLERGLRATGYVRRSVARLDARVNQPAYLIERARERIRARFERVLGGAEYQGVIAALAIGDQRAIPAAQWEAFTRTGINHLMSISGLHVTMVAALAFWLADRLWRRSRRALGWLPARKAATAAGLALAYGYALLAGFSVPTQRTVFMLSVVAAALWSGRAAAPFRVLAWALLVVTLIDPWAVLAAGFWLSFGAVAVLMCAAAGRIARSGTAGSVVPTARGRWRARARAALLEWARVQWLITLGMVPLTLALFAQVSVVSPLANAFAIPVISLLVVPIAVTAVLLPIPALLHLAHAITAACLAPIEALSALPWAVWQQPMPPWWATALALIGIAWWLLPPGWPARWLGLLVVLPALLVQPEPIPTGALQLAVLDVGHGLAVVARTANHTLVYDSGPAWSSQADAGGRVVVPFLRAQGVRRIDALLVSHDDIDHSGGALSIARALPVDALISSLPPGHPAVINSVQPLRCHAGQRWRWDDVEFRILHPAWDSYAERRPDNERSCVLQIEAFGRRVLLTADIGVASERQMLARAAAGEAPLAAEILLVPHHGSRSSSSASFVDAVRPAHALFAVGYRNRFDHPRPEVVARYRESGARIWRTDQAGALKVRVEAAGVTVAGERLASPRYWRPRPPLD
jgi:competence protein ComEC